MNSRKDSDRFQLYASLQELACQALDDDAMVDAFVEKLGHIAGIWSSMARESQNQKGQDELTSAAKLFELLWVALSELKIEVGLRNWARIQGRLQELVPEERTLFQMGLPQATIDFIKMLTEVKPPDTQVLQAKMNDLQKVPGHAFWNIALLLFGKRLEKALTQGDTKQVSRWRVGLHPWLSLPDERRWEGFVVVGNEGTALSVLDEDRVRILGFAIEIVEVVQKAEQEDQSGDPTAWEKVKLSPGKSYSIRIEMLDRANSVAEKEQKPGLAPAALDACDPMRARATMRMTGGNHDDSTDRQASSSSRESTNEPQCLPCWYQWAGELRAFRLGFVLQEKPVESKNAMRRFLERLQYWFRIIIRQPSSSPSSDGDAPDPTSVSIESAYLVKKVALESLGDPYIKPYRKVMSSAVKLSSHAKYTLSLRVLSRSPLGLHWSDPLKLPVVFESRPGELS